VFSQHYMISVNPVIKSCGSQFSVIDDKSWLDLLNVYKQQ